MAINDDGASARAAFRLSQLDERDPESLAEIQEILERWADVWRAEQEDNAARAADPDRIRANLYRTSFNDADDLRPRALQAADDDLGF